MRRAMRGSLAGSMIGFAFSLATAWLQPRLEAHGYTPAPDEFHRSPPSLRRPTEANDRLERENPRPSEIASRLRAPLTAPEVAVLLSGAEDPPRPVRIHYVQSNETRHDLFASHIEGLGGIYIGVGSDQNYTLAAMADAEFVFVLDIDERVVDVHRIYRALIPLAADADALISLLAWEQRKTTHARLEHALAAESEHTRASVLATFRRTRETLFRHLLRVRARKRGGRPTTWLSNPALYNVVRELYLAGRVRIMSGDLIGSSSLKTVAQAAAAFGQPVRVLYLSNAEEYFDYAPNFVDNVNSLPVDERSVVLRTIYGDEWVHADLWAYQVQPILDFADRLTARARSRNPMLRALAHEGKVDRTREQQGLTMITHTPTP